MRTLTAEEADALVGGSWFDGYTEQVEVYDEHVEIDAFDAAARADERRGTEYVVFAGGLSVTTTLDLSSGVHSIYFVRGTLRARRLILGDAVLVADRVVANEWVFAPRTEGIFEVASAQVEGDEDDLLAGVEAPILAIFSRRSGEYVLRECGTVRSSADLVPEVISDGEVDHTLLRTRLLEGAAIFATRSG